MGRGLARQWSREKFHPKRTVHRRQVEDYLQSAKQRDAQLSNTLRLPFGKHKGQALSDIPLGYIGWLLQQEWVRPYLRTALENELEGRGDKILQSGYVPQSILLGNLR